MNGATPTEAETAHDAGASWRVREASVQDAPAIASAVADLAGRAER